jgi:molybdopterin synthase catalytic subunit
MSSERVAGEVDATSVAAILVTADPLDLADHHGFVADPAAGCSVVFTGIVRNHAPGKQGVTHLEYEAYAGVVEDKIAEVVAEARSRWAVLRIAVSHRTGTVAVGEPAVVVAVSGAHRSETFEAARYLIDEVKRRAPIWKKEHWPGGAEWVEGA